LEVKLLYDMSNTVNVWALN